MSRCLIVVVSLLLVAPRSVLAQASECGPLLLYAGEKWTSESDTHNAQSVVNFFCSRSFNSEGEAKDFGASVSIPIDGVLIGGGLNGSGSSFKQAQQEFCSSETRRNTAIAHLRQTMSGVNSVVAKAVQDCVNLRGVGVWASLETIPDNPKAFKIRVVKRGIECPTKATSFTHVPKQTVDCSAIGEITAAGKEILCTRPADQAVTVSINIDNVELLWNTPSTVPAINVPRFAACNPGGADFIFPRGNPVAGDLTVDTLIHQAALCTITAVTFSYDCNWPSGGPTWVKISDAPAEAPKPNGDVPAHAHLDLHNLRDGRGNLVPVPTTCQILANVRYSSGLVVPNSTSFLYSGQ
jgi:hypothetical protein